MEGSDSSSVAQEAVVVKKEPSWEGSAGSCGVSEAGVREGLYTDRELKHEAAPEPEVASEHLKEEADSVKEECELSAAQAALYAGHQVKGELVLGPEGPQLRDAVFAWHAAAQTVSAGAGRGQEPAPSLGRGEPLARECRVRLERIVIPDKSSIGKTYDAEIKITDKYIKVGTAENNYNCSICHEKFPLKSSLMEHFVVHTEVRVVRSHELVALTREQSGRATCAENNSDEEHHTNTNNSSDLDAYTYPIGRNSFALKSRSEHIHSPTSAGQPETRAADSGRRSRSPGRVSSRAREQLAMACSVSLRDDTAPRPRTSPHQSSLTTHIREQAERTGRRGRASGSGAPADTYTRDTCGEQFAREPNIVTHLKEHADYQVCPNNDTPFTDYSQSKCELTSQIKIHTGDKPYSCDICDKKFRHKYTLTAHIRVHTGSKPYACDVCSKKFSHSGHLTSHKRIHSGEKPFSCDICNKAFTRKSTLNEHIRVHTGCKPYACDVCSKKFSHSGDLKSHKRIHSGEKPFSCDLCNKAFTQKSNLNKHIRVQTGCKPYACDVCSKKFSYSGDLKSHKRIHSGEKPFSCDICNKAFTQKSTLYKHIRVHTGSKPYTCDVCSKKFSHSGVLLSHKRIHSGEKPFSCDICKKAFTQKSTLYKHIRVHTGSKPYTCDVCSKKFSHSGVLLSHKRIHSGEKPFSCDTCKKAFTQKSTLYNHIRVHTGYKPYTCNICSKKFSRSEHLTSHKRIHSGEKPFSCDICNKAFTQKFNLNEHIRVHTGSKP